MVLFDESSIALYSSRRGSVQMKINRLKHMQMPILIPNKFISIRKQFSLSSLRGTSLVSLALVPRSASVLYQGRVSIYPRLALSNEYLKRGTQFNDRPP